MLAAPASKPQVIVKVNGILSALKYGADGSYETDSAKTPVLNSFSLSGSTLSLSFAANMALTANNFKVTFGGSACSSINAADLSAVTCTLTTNPDSSVAVEAGAHKPIIVVDDFGYADVSATTASEIPISVTSITPSQGSINGGKEITIVGTGFPLSSGSASNLVLNIGTALVKKVKSVTNTQIVFILPQKDTADTAGVVKVKISFSGKVSDITTAASDFTYSTAGIHTISSISPTSASPVLKGDIVITGATFGTVVSDVQVFLDFKNGSIAYELFVTACSDTQITATLSGGKVGNYTVRVVKKDIGNSIGDLPFKYIIELSSISPTKGSKYGGQILTINGSHFSSILSDNAVYFEQPLTDTFLRCLLITVSNTQLMCKTPVMDPKVTGPLAVVVEGRLIESSVCTGTCVYEYVDSLTGSVTTFGSSYKNGDTVQIEGTGFAAGTPINIVEVEILETKGVVTATVADDTHLSFAVPNNLVAGNYTFAFNVKGNGYAGFIEASVLFAVNSSSPTTISLGGEEITIIGSGFDIKTAKVTIGGVECTINSVSPSQIQCRAPARTSASTQNIVVT